MGMFDWVQCDIRLPKLDYKLQKEFGAYSWQTKDLDNMMDLYIITSGGILLKENQYSIERVYLNDSFHFYYKLDNSPWPKGYYEYHAIFRQGELRSIDLVEADGVELEQVKKADEEAYTRRIEALIGNAKGKDNA
jgi:hypothetical protein